MKARIILFFLLFAAPLGIFGQTWTPTPLTLVGNYFPVPGTQAFALPSIVPASAQEV